MKKIKLYPQNLSAQHLDELKINLSSIARQQDCFFDSLIERLNTENDYSTLTKETYSKFARLLGKDKDFQNKQLRQLCYDYLKEHQDNDSHWVKKAIQADVELGGPDYKTCVEKILYTTEETTEYVPGRLHIEGRIICEVLKVSLLVTPLYSVAIQLTGEEYSIHDYSDPDVWIDPDQCGSVPSQIKEDIAKEDELEWNILSSPISYLPVIVIYPTVTIKAAPAAMPSSETSVTDALKFMMLGETNPAKRQKLSLQPNSSSLSSSTESSNGRRIIIKTDDDKNIPEQYTLTERDIEKLNINLKMAPYTDESHFLGWVAHHAGEQKYFREKISSKFPELSKQPPSFLNEIFFRGLCHNYLKKHQHDADHWVTNAIADDVKLGGPDYKMCLENILRPSVKVVDGKNQTDTDSSIIHGRPHIEGRIICEILDIPLYVEENFHICINIQGPIRSGSMHQYNRSLWVDKTGCQSMTPEEVAAKIPLDDGSLYPKVKRKDYIPRIQITYSTINIFIEAKKSPSIKLSDSRGLLITSSSSSTSSSTAKVSSSSSMDLT